MARWRKVKIQASRPQGLPPLRVSAKTTANMGPVLILQSDRSHVFTLTTYYARLEFAVSFHCD